MGKPEDMPQDIEATQREIKEMFAEWVPCEAEDHEPSKFHGGSFSGGKYYTVKRCPNCGDSLTRLVCAEYAEVIREYIAENLIASCMDCGFAAPVSTFFGPVVSRESLV